MTFVSRGMGAAKFRKATPTTVKKKDGNEPVKLYSKGGNIERKGKTRGKVL